MPRSWLSVCDDFAESEGIARDMFELLFCFRAADPRGGPPPPPEPTTPGDFIELERELLDGDMLARLEPALREDVDADQAQTFVRRMLAVDRALDEFGDATGRLLRVGLRQRLTGILGAPGPRVVRVRALADFYYSQLGRHGLRVNQRGRGAADAPTLVDRVAQLTWRSVAPGIDHGRIAGPTSAGPVHVNLLRVDPKRVRLDVRDCSSAVERGQDFASLSVGLGASAAVSGGFFLYSEPDIEAPSARFDPVGLLVEDGRVLSPPVFRRGTLAIDEHNQVEIGRLGLESSMLVVIDGDEPLPLDGQDPWNRSRGRIGPGVPSIAIVGDRVVAVGRSLAIPLNGFVVPLAGAKPPSCGAAVRYAPILGRSGEPIRAAIAGGPMLLEHGRRTLDLQREEFWATAPPVTFSQDETGDRNLLPRLAVGLDHADHLLFAAIDGRNFERALGMTLTEVGALMLELGCHTATNLDGGSSKRMIVAGEVVDLPSMGLEASASRPVHGGVFMFADAH